MMTMGSLGDGRAPRNPSAVCQRDGAGQASQELVPGQDGQDVALEAQGDPLPG